MFVYGIVTFAVHKTLIFDKCQIHVQIDTNACYATYLPNSEVRAVAVDVGVIGQQKTQGNIGFIRDQLAEIPRLHDVVDSAILSSVTKTEVLRERSMSYVRSG